MFDNIYGCPGNCEYADVIRANGLDGFLSKYNGDTRRVKELLQSASTVDFVFGVGTLGKMLDDAGHTNMFEALMNSAGDSLRRIFSIPRIISGSNMVTVVKEHCLIIA